MDIEEFIRPELITMKSYTPVEPTEVLSQRAELPVEKVIKLDGNENPYGCSPKVYQSLATYSYYHHYPDPEQRELRKALEVYSGISYQHIICGMGSDELIDLILRLFLNPGDEVINCPPTFGMYPFSTDICGGKVIDVPRNEDFTLDISGVKKALTKKTKVVFIATPNNPTGNTITEQETMELIDTGRIIVLDEAYFEFSNATMVNIVPAHSNLIVLRTFSKWAGLAGLRIGYGFFPVEMVSYLMKIKQPYNVNVAAQAAVLASLADIDYLRSNVLKIITERERLFSELKELDWLRPYPSSGNFILCCLHCHPERNEESCAPEVWHQLQKKGISVRYFDSPRLKDYLRISVGKPGDTDDLIKALKEVKHG